MDFQKERKLDCLLQECKDELSRHRTEEDWHNISVRICDNPNAKKDNPLFLMYLNKLKEDDLIEKNETGYVATFKGLFFKGYEKTKKEEKVSKNLQTVQTWAISIGTAIAGLYALVQIMQNFLC